MKILIVDDETVARERLRSLLEEVDCAYRPVAEAADGVEALRLVQALSPDLVFMDVQMPGLDGLNAAREIARMERPPAMIFCTAYDEYAVAAFDLCAVDYLLKPIRIQRLQDAMQRVRRFSPLIWRQIENSGLVAQTACRSHLCLYRHGELVLVPIDSVAFFRADSKYTTVRTDREEYLCDESLVALEAEFGGKLLRIHRNALVAAERVSGLARLPTGAIGLRLRGIPELLEISRRHLPVVRAQLKARSKMG